jgi:pimeloyl-ACP methyl ester carboxylesterase
LAATAHTPLAPRQPANPRYVARGRTRARRGFTFVATDLRGYGDSSKPETTRDHAPYSKREMAQDQISVMRQLSLERFNVCGHDRGCRVAYWMALDHPERVLRPAVLDIVCPRAETFSRADMVFGIGYWHRFFLAQPHALPERLIGTDPAYFFLSRAGRDRTPSPPRRWRSTSDASATRGWSTPSARTTGPPPPSTSPTTRRTAARGGA